MSRSAIHGDEGDGHPGLRRLQELVRHGYAPDERRLTENGSLLLRHDSAPDLVLRSDGSVDVPLDQPLKRSVANAPLPARSKRRWPTFALIVIGLAIYTVAALAVLVTAMGGL